MSHRLPGHLSLPARGQRPAQPAAGLRVVGCTAGAQMFSGARPREQALGPNLTPPGPSPSLQRADTRKGRHWAASLPALRHQPGVPELWTPSAGHHPHSPPPQLTKWHSELLFHPSRP